MSSTDEQQTELTAMCSREQARQLIPYDHHRVRVNGHLGVMLTYQWGFLENPVEPLLLKIVFRYAEKHPVAPPEVQEILDQLEFVPVMVDD